jgi:hypothetical protein
MIKTAIRDHLCLASGSARTTAHPFMAGVFPREQNSRQHPPTKLVDATRRSANTQCQHFQNGAMPKIFPVVPAPKVIPAVPAVPSTGVAPGASRTELD